MCICIILNCVFFTTTVNSMNTGHFISNESVCSTVRKGHTLKHVIIMGK